MLNFVLDLCCREYKFEDFEACGTFFKELINILRQMNYSEFKSEKFTEYEAEISKMIENNGK